MGNLSRRLLAALASAATEILAEEAWLVHGTVSDFEMLDKWREEEEYEDDFDEDEGEDEAPS